MKINKGHYLLNSMTLLFFQLMSPSSETVFRHPFNFAGICINFFALFSRLHNYYRQRGIESNENNLSGRTRKILLLKFAIALNEFIFQSPTTRIAWNFYSDEERFDNLSSQPQRFDASNFFSCFV